MNQGNKKLSNTVSLGLASMLENLIDPIRSLVPEGGKHCLEKVGLSSFSTGKRKKIKGRKKRLAFFLLSFLLSLQHMFSSLY